MKPHAHHIERPLTAGGVCYPPYRYTRGYAVLIACESWDQGVYGHPRAPMGARVLPSPPQGERRSVASLGEARAENDKRNIT